MKIIGWTDWDNPHYKELFPLGAPIDWKEQGKICKLVSEELRKKGYKFTGNYHQNGYYGAPVFDNGTVLKCSQRTWGGIMADAYPDEVDNHDGYGYCKWAWLTPEGEEEIIPSGDDAIDYDERPQGIYPELDEMMRLMDSEE